jgi:hypothetical protein
MRNAKQAARGCSGKLATICPVDVDQMELVCKDLDAQLGGEPRPYLPDCLEPHFAARNAVTTGDLPYAIESALLFSNGGGVYVGRDTRDGRSVVLKEARPHAGLTGDGADAVTRLRREHDALRRLAGIGACRRCVT